MPATPHFNVARIVHKRRYCSAAFRFQRVKRVTPPLRIELFVGSRLSFAKTKVGMLCAIELRLQELEQQVATPIPRPASAVEMTTLTLDPCSSTPSKRI